MQNDEKIPFKRGDYVRVYACSEPVKSRIARIHRVTNNVAYPIYCSFRYSEADGDIGGLDLSTKCGCRIEKMTDTIEIAAARLLQGI